MNWLCGFIIVFVTVYAVVLDPAEGAALYRNQDVNSDRYLDDHSRDYGRRPDFPSDEATYPIKPDISRGKDIRTKLSPDDIIQQTMRERSRGLSSAAAPRSGLLESEEDPRGRADTRYYGKTVDGASNLRRRPNSSPVVDYDDSEDVTGPSRTYNYPARDYKRVDNKSPGPVNRNTESKYKLINIDAQSESNEVDNLDLETLSKIIKNLRSENADMYSTSRPGDGRRTSVAPEAKGRTSSDGVQRTAGKPQGNVDLDEYLLARTSGGSSRNVNQGPMRKETGSAAQEHVKKLLEELKKLEAMKKLQRTLENVQDTAEYYELKQELANDVRIIRNKVRSAIAEMQ